MLWGWKQRDIWINLSEPEVTTSQHWRQTWTLSQELTIVRELWHYWTTSWQIYKVITTDSENMLQKEERVMWIYLQECHSAKELLVDLCSECCHSHMLTRAVQQHCSVEDKQQLIPSLTSSEVQNNKGSWWKWVIKRLCQGWEWATETCAHWILEVEKC